MDSGKGKGRATTEAEEVQSKTTPSNAPADSSILSRIANSATRLTQSALTAPNVNELNQTANAALSGSGKATSSSRNSDRDPSLAEGSKISQQSTNIQGQGSTREHLRTGHSEQHSNQSEMEFSSFLDGVDTFQPSKAVSVERDENDALSEAWTRSRYPRNIVPNVQSTTITEQEDKDGEEVVAMLSDPRSLTEQYEPPESEDENYDWGLSPEQLTQLRAMTRHLFPAPESHSNIDPFHPLNLIPGGGTSNLELFSQSFDNQNPEAREAWREQWDGILTRYADEVWGDLLPLVKQARQEIENLGQISPKNEPPTALRRLGAILGHLQTR